MLFLFFLLHCLWLWNLRVDTQEDRKENRINGGDSFQQFQSHRTKHGKRRVSGFNCGETGCGVTDEVCCVGWMPYGSSVFPEWCHQWDTGAATGTGRVAGCTAAHVSTVFDNLYLNSTISSLHAIICARQSVQRVAKDVSLRSVWLGLPDLPYFTGAPVFQVISPVSRLKPIRETLSPVFRLLIILLHDLAVLQIYIYIYIYQQRKLTFYSWWK